MKIITPVIVAVLFIMTTAFPQDEHRATLSFGGGLSFPSQPNLFSDYWKTGFNVGAGLGYKLSTAVSIDGTFEYNNFAFDDEGLLNDLGATGYGITIQGGSATIFSVIGSLKANLIPPPKPVSPYFLVGIGLFSLSTSDITISTPYGSEKKKGDSESAFTIVFGVGLDIRANETTTVFIQVADGVGFTKGQNTSYVPLKAGLRFNL